MKEQSIEERLTDYYSKLFKANVKVEKTGPSKYDIFIIHNPVIHNIECNFIISKTKEI